MDLGWGGVWCGGVGWGGYLAEGELELGLEAGGLAAERLEAHQRREEPRRAHRRRRARHAPPSARRHGRGGAEERLAAEEGRAAVEEGAGVVVVGPWLRRPARLRPQREVLRLQEVRLFPRGARRPPQLPRLAEPGRRRQRCRRDYRHAEPVRARATPALGAPWDGAGSAPEVVSPKQAEVTNRRVVGSSEVKESRLEAVCNWDGFVLGATLRGVFARLQGLQYHSARPLGFKGRVALVGYRG